MANPFWTGVFITSVLVGGVSGVSAANAPEYGASAPGLLDDEYVEISSRKGGTRYKVSYAFTVEGERFSGKDTIRDEPRSPVCQVFYEPADPTDNGLSRTKSRSLAYAGLGLAFLGLVSSGKRLLRGGA